MNLPETASRDTVSSKTPGDLQEKIRVLLVNIIASTWGLRHDHITLWVEMARPAALGLAHCTWGQVFLHDSPVRQVLQPHLTGRETEAQTIKVSCPSPTNKSHRAGIPI